MQQALKLIGGPRNGEVEHCDESLRFIHVDWFPEPGKHVKGKYRRQASANGRDMLLWEKEEVRAR